MKVYVIGLGNIGLPVALHVSKYFDTIGIDINEKAVERAKSFGLKASNILGGDPDVYIVSVDTNFKNGSPDMSSVDAVCSKLDSNSLISIESTLSVGTSRKLATKYELENLVVCPHRWWKEDQVNHGIVQLRVIGGLNEKSLETGKNFYTMLGIPILPLSSLEMAELAKVTENSHYFVQIAFAEEMKMLCDKNGLDFEELRKACNTKWNVDILEARDGIIGHCLPKDIRYLLSLYSESTLLSGAIATDRKYSTRARNEQHPQLVQTTARAARNSLELVRKYL
jgi:nucleotide sugar dehydrogenase